MVDEAWNMRQLLRVKTELQTEKYDLWGLYQRLRILGSHLERRGSWRVKALIDERSELECLGDVVSFGPPDSTVRFGFSGRLSGLSGRGFPISVRSTRTVEVRHIKTSYHD